MGGHRLVEGWLKPQVLTLMRALSVEQTAQGVRGGIVEIGVHHGRLFLGLHLMRQAGERSLAIDLFGDQAANLDQSGKGDEEAFRRNLARWAGSTEGVDILQADSTSLSPGDIIHQLGSQVRLFSVDGGHTAEVVESDMRLATTSLAAGGIIIADDVFNSQWPGVFEGTQRFLDSSSDVVPFAVGFNKVLFTTPANAAGYREIVSGVAESRLWHHKNSVMHGHDVVVAWPASAYRRARRIAKRALART